MQDWLSSSLVQHSSGSAAAASASRASTEAIRMYKMSSYWRSGDYTNKLMSMNRQRSGSPSLAAKIARLEESFRQAFMSQGEPLGYCNTLIRSVNGQRFDSAEEEYKYKMYSFADEINLIKQGESFPQALKKLVCEREEAIRQLRAELISNRSSKQLNLSTACERLDSLRMYSLLIIEKVAGCKRKLQVPDSPYFSEILAKLGQDVDFLRLSALRKFIEFSNHNDPLFMVPLRKFWNMEVAADCHRRPIIDLFTLDAEYHKRLEAADRFIKNTEKVDGTTQEMLNEIDARSIIQKAIEQSEKSGEGREQYISTLQKFTLPSLRSRQKTEQAYSSVKTKEVVSSLIKEVISEYKMRSKEKSVSNYYDKKKRLLSRSIERPREALPSRQSLKEKIDARPNNIRYKMCKAASLKSNGLQRQYYEEKQECLEEQSRGRLIRYLKRLPELQKQEREDYSSEKINEFEKYLLNQQYDHSSNPSSKNIDFGSLRADEIELGKLRELPGKIRFNQLGSKMHTEPAEQLRYDISNRIDRANDNKMSNNHSFKNSSLAQHNPTFRARDLPKQQQRITTPSPNTKSDISSTPQIREKSQRNHHPPQSPSNETEPVKSARCCWISQQFSYHQIVNNLSTSPDYNNSQAQSPNAFHKTAQLRRANEQRPKNLRINFQFNQQIYSPPFVPHFKIAIPNDEEQKARQAETGRQEKQADKSRPVNQEKIQDSNISSPEHKQRTVIAEAKEMSIPPFSIRQMASSAERYDVDRIEEEIQAQNGTSQRTSENMSQKVEEHPHKNSALKQSEIKQILQESQSSMDNRSNKASVRLQSRSNRSSVKEEEKSSNPPQNKQSKISNSPSAKQLESNKSNSISGKLENNTNQPSMRPVQLDNQSYSKVPAQMEDDSSNNARGQVDSKSSSNASVQVNFSTPKKSQNSMTEPIPQQAISAKQSDPSNIQVSFKKERPATDEKAQQPKPEYELPSREESSSLSFHPPEKSQILPNYAHKQSPHSAQQRPRQLSIDNASSRSSLSIKANGFPMDKPQYTAQKRASVDKPEQNAQKTLPAEEKKPAQPAKITNVQIQQPKPASSQQPKPALSSQSKNEASTTAIIVPSKAVQSQPLKKQQPKQPSQAQTDPVAVQQARRQRKSEALLQKQEERQSNPFNLLQTLPMINSQTSMAQQQKPLQKPMSSERMVQMLQKCAFQSKQIKHQDLINQLARLSPSKSQALKQLIDQSYFAHRQVYITNCLFDGQVCCYCLYYPQLSPNARTIFILHIQLVKQKFAPLQVALYNTFVKYIFINDPCESIICINYNNLAHKNVVRQLKNFQKEIPTPLVADRVSEMAFLLTRKDIQCAKEEELTSILTFINTFASTRASNQIVPGNDPKIAYGGNYLKKVGKKMVKQSKSYSINQLNAYLTQQELPKFKALKPAAQLFFTKYIVEQCFLQSKFFVYSKDFYFTVEHPHTCLYQGKNAFFLVIATSIKGKYFIFADKLYEEEVDLPQAYRAEVQGREFDSLFNSHKSKGKIVTCPTFRKQAESTLGETATLLSVELNWKDYLKGVRYMQEDRIHLELVCPFFFGLAELDELRRFQLLCRTTIEESHLIK